MLFVKEKTNSPKIVTDYRLKAAMKADYDWPTRVRRLPTKAAIVTTALLLENSSSAYQD